MLLFWGGISLHLLRNVHPPIFRNAIAIFLGCFAMNIGISSTLSVELNMTTLTVEV